MKSPILLLTLLIFLGSFAEAKRFDTSYLSLDLPAPWQCSKVDTYWICKDPRQAQAEIILFLFAKVAKQGDSVRGYWDQLRQSKTITGFNNLPIQSKVYNIQMANISNHQWVQALHGNSEIQGFASYYLATVYNNISILASISVKQGRYDQYKNVIANTMYSIKLKNIRVQERQQVQQKQSIISKLKRKLNNKSYLAIGLIVISLILLAVSFRK
ncbi:MAG: hypothetical protein CL677_08805 [Bdellovibrionaceae bacterium]|nr:hypothetical protein [Pseudobdellovibrionaceae bacterium]|tara:strand:- start:150 stop:791 length:642 start_codon:yes stop_codon:yes gene_type:complete